MSKKFKDIRWKWLAERGINVQGDDYQLDYMKSLWAPVDDIQAVFCEAKAGTGKTSLAVLAGAYEVEKETYDKLIYVRNAIPIREVGHLPGDLDDKEKPYMQPIVDTLDLIKPGTYEVWSQPNPLTKQAPRLIAVTTSFTRGVTWKRAFVIIDEAQSFDLEELQTIYTRCADDCKIVTVGSLRQNDNKKQKKFTGLTPFEIYMAHFKGTKVAYHTLVNNYRGWFADYADDVMNTVNRLKGSGSHAC
ncbi:PhoH family protein [Fredinandcohnia humi]